MFLCLGKCDLWFKLFTNFKLLKLVVMVNICVMMWMHDEGTPVKWRSVGGQAFSCAATGKLLV